MANAIVDKVTALLAEAKAELTKLETEAKTEFKDLHVKFDELVAKVKAEVAKL